MVRMKQISTKKKSEEINQEKIKSKKDKNKPETKAKKNNESQVTRRRLVLDEIEYYQGMTDNVILKIPFQRLVRQILQDIQYGKDWPVHRMSCKAICILQEVAETFLVELMSDSVECALHANRITVFPKDFELVMRLNPQY